MISKPNPKKQKKVNIPFVIAVLAAGLFLFLVDRESCNNSDFANYANVADCKK